MSSAPTTVQEYLESLPDDRRAVIESVRQEILANLPTGYEEGIQYGMIGYYVPHTIYPGGYHTDPKQPLPFAALASNKNYMSVYLNFLYSSSPERLQKFEQAFADAGKKLDMGKSCVRFKKREDLPEGVVGSAVADVSVDEFIAFYESAIKK